MGGIIGASIFGIFVLAFAVYVIYIMIKGSNERIKHNEDVINQGKEYNAEYSGEFYHVYGLPIAENSICILHLSENRIVVDCKGSVYNLDVARILDMSIKDSKEIKNSISGAVGGAMLFGPLGAFIGGSSTELHRFFIIIYKDKNDKEKCISFDMQDNLKHLKYVYKYIEKYNNSKKKEEIDL